MACIEKFAKNRYVSLALPFMFIKLPSHLQGNITDINVTRSKFISYLGNGSVVNYSLPFSWRMYKIKNDFYRNQFPKGKWLMIYFLYVTSINPCQFFLQLQFPIKIWFHQASWLRSNCHCERFWKVDVSSFWRKANAQNVSLLNLYQVTW